MPFWKRREARDADEIYEEPVEAASPEPASLEKKESRKLARLRKKAQAAARKAARESEKARKAARKVREASASSPEAVQKETASRKPEEDVPGTLAGKDRAQALAKKDQRRLKRLRRKAQRSS